MRRASTCLPRNHRHPKPENIHSYSLFWGYIKGRARADGYSTALRMLHTNDTLAAAPSRMDSHILPISYVALGLASLSVALITTTYIIFTLRMRWILRKIDRENMCDCEHLVPVRNLNHISVRALREGLPQIFSPEGDRIPLGNSEGSTVAHLVLVHRVLDTAHKRVRPLHSSYRERFDNLMRIWIVSSQPERAEWINAQLDVITHRWINGSSRLRALETLWEAYVSWSAEASKNSVVVARSSYPIVAGEPMEYKSPV